MLTSTRWRAASPPGSYQWRSYNQAIDTLLIEGSALNEATYHIGVYLPSSESGTTGFTLDTSEGYLTELSWTLNG